MSKENSLAYSIALLPDQERRKAILSLSQKEAEALLYDWEFWARPNQLPPEWDWYIWLLLSGRGYGKTRSGAELVRKWVREGFSPIALIGQTKADVRDTMVELGESAILNISPPWFRPEYEPSKRRLTWPNGVIAIIYSGDEPDQLRGPQHAKGWCDEPSKYKYPQETWDNFMFGLRIGDQPQAVVTTTPRPIPLIKTLVHDDRTAVTRGHTLENRANLAPDFLNYILSRYEGTRIGRQELAGEILDDNPDALWKRARIDELRVRQYPDLVRIVVGVDPEAANTETSSETGIVVADIANVDGMTHGYILDDLTIKASPSNWATAAITGYYKFQADRIIGEVNNGGDMVEHTVNSVDSSVPFKQVRASRGKLVRAEPISALYEQGRVHHVGFFPELEDQMCITEGTLISTISGLIPIEQIKVGMLVWTRKGLRPVQALKYNGVKAILRMESEKGYNVRATGNHPFYLKGKGWTNASELKIGDRVICLSQLNALTLSSWVRNISAITTDTTRPVGHAEGSYFIGQFGNLLMARFLKALKYTIRTKTEAIIPSTTLRPVRKADIAAITGRNYMVLPRSRLNREVSKCGSSGKLEKAFCSNAKTAGKNLSDVQRTGNFAQAFVINDTIASIHKDKPARVWDLQVAAEHEYFAGGFLVHNCEWVPGDKSPDRMDALVWALTELFEQGEPGKVESKGAITTDKSELAFGGIRRKNF